MRNFNPRAPCGARPAQPGKERADRHISTHAPLAGRDFIGNLPNQKLVFQPTRPLRGATRGTAGRGDLAGFQPTRPLRGATTRGATCGRG